jgi:outer membrane protein assembly factor BamA
VENGTIFYDSGNKTAVHGGAGTVYNNLPEPEPKDDSEKFEPSFLDRGFNWIFIPKIGYNADDGFIFGGGLQLHKYNFREVPQEYKQELFLSYATRFGKGTIAYLGDFYSLVKDGRLNLIIGGTEQFITRYFGYGNETTFDSELEEDDFYEVDQRLITLFPTMFYGFTKNITGNIGLSYIQTKTSLDSDTLLTGFRYGDYGIGTLNQLGIHLGFEFEGRNNIEFPTNGYFISLAGSLFPAVFNISEPFYRSNFDLRGFFNHPSISWLTLALRASGEKVWGKYPFYAGATIGGIESIRGYNQDRFSGDAALFGQAEFRMFITNLNLILRSKFGLNAFVESGKVWVAGEDSKKWHPSYGLGFWLNYLDGTFIISSYVATSPERTTFAIGLGMGF